MNKYRFHYIKNFNKIKSKSNIAIYGAGGRGHRLYELILKRRPDLNIVCFIDDSVMETKTNLPIGEYSILSKKYQWDYIFIASIHIKEIIEKLKPTENLMLISLTNYEGVDKIDLINSIGIISKTMKILYIFKNLSKNKCRYLYFQLLLLRIWGKGGSAKVYLSKLFNAQQYFEYINANNIKNAMDAGVYDGYTSIQFIKYFKNLENIYGFDISDESIIKSKNRDLLDNKIFHLCLYPLSNKIQDIYISYNHSNPSATKIEINPNTSSFKTKSVTIDKFFDNQNNKLDFIKFDIEGGESNALAGGLNYIQKNRPQLAISIYHSPEDFINIPYYLMRNLTDYKYYIGHYSMDVYETVVYAIPKEIDEN